MMQLFEATNGWMGESQVRCYVWADSAERALELAKAAYAKARGPSHGDSWVDNVTVMHLLSADTPEFCTKPTDWGWGVDEPVAVLPLTEAEQQAHMQELILAAAEHNNLVSEAMARFATRETPSVQRYASLAQTPVGLTALQTGAQEWQIQTQGPIMRLAGDIERFPDGSWHWRAYDTPELRYRGNTGQGREPTRELAIAAAMKWLAEE